MKVQYNSDGSSPSFKIVPTSERSIIEHFIDHETGYVVVCETNNDDPHDNKAYYTLLDPQTGISISPEQRFNAVSGQEQVVEDHQHALRLHTTRTVDLSTGQERLIETLTDLTTSHIVARQRSIAFSQEPRETLLITYLAEQERKQGSETFWSQDYPQMSLEQRGAFWLTTILRQMRMQGEAGLDEYAIFTPASYNEWRRRDPDVDRVLEFVIDHFPDDTEEVRAEIYRRLGKQ